MLYLIILCVLPLCFCANSAQILLDWEGFAGQREATILREQLSWADAKGVTRALEHTQMNDNVFQLFDGTVHDTEVWYATGMDMATYYRTLKTEPPIIGLIESAYEADLPFSFSDISDDRFFQPHRPV